MCVTYCIDKSVELKLVKGRKNYSGRLERSDSGIFKVLESVPIFAPASKIIYLTIGEVLNFHRKLYSLRKIDRQTNIHYIYS